MSSRQGEHETEIRPGPYYSTDSFTHLMARAGLRLQPCGSQYGRQGAKWFSPATRKALLVIPPVSSAPQAGAHGISAARRRGRGGPTEMAVRGSPSATAHVDGGAFWPAREGRSDTTLLCTVLCSPLRSRAPDGVRLDASCSAVRAGASYWGTGRPVIRLGVDPNARRPRAASSFCGGPEWRHPAAA